MIKYIFVCLFASMAAVLAADQCVLDVDKQCSHTSNELSLKSCNAIFGGYSHHGNLATEMQAYANLHLERSYEYLLLSAYYDNYQTNRGGFSKLFRKFSDSAWEKTVDLIKHITMRGGEMDFKTRSTQEVRPKQKNILELHEMEALARVLDTQKELAERAFHIHREATRNNEQLHDAEIAQYLEEEFVEDQAKVIRDLAGHTTDLKKVISQNVDDISLAMYLFDEYLKKVV